jgi:autotransporter-associated beta strand protein
MKCFVEKFYFKKMIFSFTRQKVNAGDYCLFTNTKIISLKRHISFFKNCFFNKISFLILLTGLVNNYTNAQNAIVGTGFTAGWGGACGTNTNFTYFSAGAGASYSSGNLTPNGTGNQYWRIGIDWGGTIKQINNNGGSADAAVSPGTKYSINSTCVTLGALYYNIPSAGYKYIFKTRDAGTNPTGDWVFFEVQGTPITVSSVSQLPTSGNVVGGQPVKVTATLSGTLPTGQGVYLRYTNNSYSTSAVVAMTGTATSYSATIPGSNNTGGVGCSYYIFTSGSGLTITGTDVDLFTINLNNNVGSNYTYTPSSTTVYKSTTSGNWNANGTWVGGVVPPVGSPVEIQNGHNVTISNTFLAGNATTQAGNITVDAGGTLTMNPGGATFITLNGTNLFYGDYVQTTGTLAGNNGGCTFYGNCTLTAGAFNNQEYFESSSTLVFNGITQNTNIWNSGVSSGIAVPYAVTVNANTTLTSANYTAIGLLTINASKTFTFSGTLTVGDMTGSGSLTSTGTSTFVTGSANTSNTFSGVIGVSGPNLTVTKNGTGTWTLSGTANTYTQATNINAGILVIASIANQSSASSIGTGATTNQMNIATGATLKYNGTGHSSNRPITLTGSGAIIDASGSGLLTLSGGISGATFNLILTGTGSGTLTGAITTSTGTVTKTGSGIWTSGANHTYTGITYINAGTFSISTGANLGSVPGAPIANIVTLAGGTLGVTGPSWAISVNRGITLTSSTSSKIDIASGVTFTCPAIITGGGNIEKTNTGILLLTGANTYTGSTTLTAGTLQLGIANAIPVAATGGGVTFNGGILSSGSTTGFSDGVAGTTNMGTITLSNSSTIALGTGSHSLFFAASNGTSWTSSTILTITGWSGTAGASGTAGKIFVGANTGGLTAAQLVQIYFSGYGPAMILSTGEVVPAAVANTMYRSRQTGVWSSTSTWDYSTDGTNWCLASNTPSYTNGTITIRNTHTVSVDVNVTIDETTINTGGTVDLSGAIILTINNGSGTDLNVSGYFKQSNGTLTNNGQIVVQSGGVIEQAKNLTPIPTATWNTGSTCYVTGWTTSTLNAVTTFGGIDQSFANFTWNCAQAGFIILEPNSMSVAGLFRVQSTGSQNLVLGNAASVRSLTVDSFQIDNTGFFYVAGSGSTANMTFIINGRFNQTGGDFEVCRSPNAGVSGNCTIGGSFTTSGGITKIVGTGSGSGSNVSTLTISGNTLVNGGQLQLNSYPTAYDGRLFIKGDLTITAGSLLYSSDHTTGTSGVYFDGTGTQSFSCNGIGLLFSKGNDAVGRRFYYKTSSGPSALNETYVGSVLDTTINGLEGIPASGYAAWPTSGTIINNLTINNSGGINLSSSKTINGVANLSSGTLDMDGSTIVMGNSSANVINVTGVRSVINSNTSESYIGVTNSDLTITSVSGTSLSIGTKVELWTNKGVDFGANFTTVNDTFRIKSNGFGLNNAPFYSTTSTLIYDCGCSFNSIGPGTKEWYENTFGTNAGVPNNVMIKAGTSLNFSNTGYPHEMQGSLTIGENSGSSSLTLSTNSGGDLNVGGNWTRTAFGSFNANDRAVFFNSTISPVTITAYGGETFPYLFITKSALANTVNLADSIIITKEIHFTKGTFNLSNSDVIIRSTSSTTANVTTVAASTDFSLSYGTGRFSIERYLPMDVTGNYVSRRWRLMGIPISSTNAPTINAAWQEGSTPFTITSATSGSVSANDQNPGYGTRITNGTTSANGFDAGTTANPSIYYWNGSTWLVPSNTSNTITSQNAYMLFVRGNRSVAISNQYQTTSGFANLRIKGKINTGTVNYSVPTGYNMFSNPYASTVNLHNVDYNGAGNTNTFYLWDPKLLGSKNVGGWVTFSYSGSSYGNSYDFVPHSGTGMSSYANNGTIESGNAFMLNNTTGSSTTISFTETSKITGSSTTGIASRPSSGDLGQNIYATFYTNLFYRDANDSIFLADGVLTGYGDGLSNNIDEMDVRKAQLFQTKEKIGQLRNDSLFAIERRKVINSADTIFLQIIKLDYNYKYQLQFIANNFSPLLSGYLIDKYLDIAYSVNTQGITIHDFVTDGSANSLAADRFMVVFKIFLGGPLPVKFKDLDAWQQPDGKTNAVEWKVENETNTKEYLIERSTDGIVFNLIGNTSATGSLQYNWSDDKISAPVNYYRVTGVGTDGNKFYSKIVSVKTGKVLSSVTVYPNPVKDDQIHLKMNNMPDGLYNIKLINSSGQLILFKEIDHKSGNSINVIKIGNDIASGIYNMEVVNKQNGNIINLNIE